MTPVEERQRRIVNRMKEFANMGLRISPADAGAWVDNNDPSLAFQASQQIAGREFANVYTGSDNTARNQGGAAADAARRAGIAERARIRDLHMPKVHARMKTAGITYAKAFELEKKENPEFANAVSTQTSVTGLSTDDMSAATEMRLPFDVTPEEFEAAKTAGSKDQQKVWDALVKYAQQKFNYTPYVAQTYCLGRFSQAGVGVEKLPAPAASSQGKSFDAAKFGS